MYVFVREKEREGGTERVYQMAQFIGCASLLSTPGWGKVFSGDFTMNLTPHYRALSSALQIEKLKRPLDSELEILDIWLDADSLVTLNYSGLNEAAS